MKFSYLSIALFVVLTGCGGGGDTLANTTETPNTINPATDLSSNDPVTSFVAPTDTASLTEALTTRFASASDFDVWLCAPDSNPDNTVAYSLPAAGTLGQGMVGIEYSLSTGGETMITWRASSADAVATQTEGSGLEITTSNYVFTDETTMSYLLFGITVNCNRVDSSVVFGGAVPQQTPVTTPNPGSVDGSPAQAPQGFSRLHAYNTFGFVGTNAQLVTEVIALFDDGRYTEDLSTVFAQGVAESLAQNPSDWGQYQFINGVLSLRPDNQLDFEEESEDFTLEAAGNDTRFTGCYDAIGGSSVLSISPVSTLSVSSYCFNQSGRFTHDSSVFVTSPNLVSAQGNDRSGTYRTDGYAMRLIYDNGLQTTVSFSYMSDDRTHIGVNGSRFIQ